EILDDAEWRAVWPGNLAEPTLPVEALLVEVQRIIDTEPEVIGRILEQRSDLVPGQSVSRCDRGEAAVPKFAQRFGASHPESAVSRCQNRIRLLRAQAVTARNATHWNCPKTIHPARSPDPLIALAVLVQRLNIVPAQTVRSREMIHFVATD